MIQIQGTNPDVGSVTVTVTEDEVDVDGDVGEYVKGVLREVEDLDTIERDTTQTETNPDETIDEDVFTEASVERKADEVIDWLSLRGFQIDQSEADADSGKANKADVPDNAVSISDPSEAPDGARTITGPGGGLYYVPEGGGGGGEPGVDRPEGYRDEDRIQELEEFVPESIGRNDGDRVTGLSRKLAESGASVSEITEAFEDNVDDWGEREQEMKKKVVTSATASQKMGTRHGEKSLFTGPNDEYPRESKRELRDELDSDQFETVKDQFDTWHSGDMGESTAALYQAAAEISGNENFVDPVGGGGDPFEVDVDQEELEAVKESIEHTQEELRDTFGDTVPLTRGVHGDLADEVEGGGEVTHQSAESWSLSPGFAARFADSDNHPEADEDGVVLTDEVPVEEVIATGDTTPGVSSLESEFVVARDAVDYGPEDVSGIDDESVANLHSALAEKVF